MFFHWVMVLAFSHVPLPHLHHWELPGVRSLFTGSLPPSLQLLRLELSRLRPPGLTTTEERVWGFEGVGEEGDREGAGVVGEEEEEEVAVGVGEEDSLLGKGKEEARCSRRRRWWRRVEERSRASALKPEADRLASRAFAWLGEAVREGIAPSWGYFLRPGANAAAGEGTRPDKMPVLIPERYGSILPLKLLVPEVFRKSRDTEDRKVGRNAKRWGFQGSKGK